jgi:hypothetical protein
VGSLFGVFGTGTKIVDSIERGRERTREDEREAGLIAA